MSAIPSNFIEINMEQVSVTGVSCNEENYLTKNLIKTYYGINIHFTNELPFADKFEFETKIADNYIKNFLVSICDKLSVLEYFKQNKMQHYI